MALRSLHLNSLRYANLLTSFHIACECGYDAVEISVSKLKSFLNMYSTQDVCNLLAENHLVPACVNDIFGAESMRSEERRRVIEEMEFLAPITKAIGCNTIQICPLDELVELSWPEARRMTAKNIRRLAEIAAPYGVRIQLETMAWAPMNSLSRGLEMKDEIGCSNVGISLDLWHFYAGGSTSPDDVARMNKDDICNVHFCDGRRPYDGEAWDEEIQRAYYLGEGDIPLKEYAAAIVATGFDGAWSVEQISRVHWEEDISVVAHRLFDGLTFFMEQAYGTHFPPKLN